MNITRALTCKYNAQLSAGRVQTPTLAMVVERENEIKKFIPKDYWTIQAAAKGFLLRWQDKHNGQTRIFDPKVAEEIVNRVGGKTGRILEVKKELKKEFPPLLYDLTELQREANRKYGLSAKTTSSVMQRLYENYKLVTYPRTDSRYISDDIVPTLSERLKSIATGPYDEPARAVLRNKITVSKNFVDNSKVTDHHAIIPTEEFVNLTKLSNEELKVYNLIVRRFLAVLSPPFEYEQTSVRVEINGEHFSAKGKIVRQPGWRRIYEGSLENSNESSEGEAEQTLPALNKDESLEITSVKIRADKTKPPARYTEATLLSAMEHPGKLIDNQTLREAIENTSGLGTPATRADIIEKLFNSFYMERRGKEIVPTSKGIQLINLVPPELKSAELTAKWEQQLTEISKGKVKGDKFITDIRKYAAKLVSTVAASDQVYTHDNLTRTKCPKCGKYLLEVKGKRGQMLVCEDRNCNYRKAASITTNARCPECHKKMAIRGEGDNRLFACNCGYREKLSSFKQRKEKEKGNIKKSEVNKFLKQQNNNQSINTALADALARLKD